MKERKSNTPTQTIAPALLVQILAVCGGGAQRVHHLNHSILLLLLLSFLKFFLLGSTCSYFTACFEERERERERGERERERERDCALLLES